MSGCRVKNSAYVETRTKDQGYFLVFQYIAKLAKLASQSFSSDNKNNLMWD